MGKFLKILRYIANLIAIMGACFSKAQQDEPSSNLNQPLLGGQTERSDFKPDQNILSSNNLNRKEWRNQVEEKRKAFIKEKQNKKMADDIERERRRNQDQYERECRKKEKNEKTADEIKKNHILRREQQEKKKLEEEDMRKKLAEQRAEEKASKK